MQHKICTGNANNNNDNNNNNNNASLYFSSHLNTHTHWLSNENASKFANIQGESIFYGEIEKNNIILWFNMLFVVKNGFILIGIDILT